LSRIRAARSQTTKTAAAGAQYAIKKINDAGGVNGAKLELTTVELQKNSGSAVTEVPKLAQDNVVAILGAVSSADCLIACATANKLKIPIIVQGAAAPGVLKDSRPYGFAMAAVDISNSTPVLRKIVSDLNLKRAAIIEDATNPTTKVQAQIYKGVFNKSNVDLVKTVTFSTGDSSFAAQVTALAAAKPDVLGLAAGPEDAGRIAREIKNQGLKVQLIGTGSLPSGAAAFFAAGGEAVQGTVAAAQYDPQSQDPVATKLLKQAESDTGQSDIPLNFAYAYDAVYMLKKVMDDKQIDAGSDVTKARVSIQTGFNNLGTFDGMASKTSFNPDGTSVRPELRAVFKGSTFVIDHSSKPAN